MKNKRLSVKRKIGSRPYDGKALTIKTETNIAGALKVIIILALIACQLALLVFLHTVYALAAKWVMTFSVIVSVLTCVYVLSTNKNGLSKAVWIIFILIFITFGYIIFWLSDERILFSKAKKRYKAVFDDAFCCKQCELEIKSEAVKQNSNYLYSTGKFKTFTNCDINYFSSGTLLFDDVIDRLKQAKEFVFIEFFIIADGVLFNRIFDILEKKILEGVEVRVIYDDLGCKKTLTGKAKNRLKKIGVKIMPFNKMMPIFSVALNYRDHRKIIVIDGKIAYTGGSNLADEYINERRMHGYWKDTGIKLSGEAVDAFTLMFLRQWEVLNKCREDYSKFLNRYEKTKNSSLVIPYADGLDYEHAIARGVYENMIASANEYLYIMSPYFIVDDGITNLLINKALAGVDVRIVLPGIPDKAFVYTVSRNNCEKLMDYGVKVYICKNAFVHSKLVVTEDAVAVGSVNMDLRSFYQQFECAVYCDDEVFMKEIMLDFEKTFEISERVSEKNKWNKNIFYRMFVGAMQVFAPFM